MAHNRIAKYREIVDFCKAGGSVQEAAAKFGCCTSTVKAACAEMQHQLYGVVVERHRKVSEWVKQHNASLKEAMKEFGFSRAIVIRSCERFGVELRADNTLKPKLSSPSLGMLARLIAGEGYSEIAVDFGVTRQRVYELRKNAEAAGVFDAIENKCREKLKELKRSSDVI